MTHSSSPDKTFFEKRSRLPFLLLLLALSACQKEDAAKADLAKARDLDARPPTTEPRGSSPGAHEKLDTPRQKRAQKSREPECPSFLNPRRVGALDGPKLTEVSGIVASEEYADLLWAHNDSGDDATLYSINMSGKLERSFRLPRQAHDWEDIALLSRPNKRAMIYIADTGDNWNRRTTGVVIHRFKEPQFPYAKDASGDRSAKVNKVESMHLTFPDGPHDTEALLVDPWTAEVVVLTKTKLGWPQIFSVDEFSSQATLHYEGAITAQSAGRTLFFVTGADVSADGHWIVVRTYTGVYLFYRGPEQSLSDALKTRACLLSSPPEMQSEAIAFLRTLNDAPSAGRSVPPSFLTVSEGARVPLFLSESELALPKK